MRYTKEQIDEKFKALHASIQDAVLSSKTEEEIRKVSDKYKLHVDVAGLLNEEIVYTLVGLNNASDFKTRLASAGIPEDTLDSIVKDVNEQIFLPIRESLKEIENKNIEEAKMEQREEDQNREQDVIQETVQKTQGQLPHQAPQTTPEKKEPAHPNLSDESLGGQAHSSDIFEDKLTKQVRTPKEHVRLDEPAIKSQEKKKPYSIDPYREPIE